MNNVHSIKCGHCDGRHATIDEVRDCAMSSAAGHAVAVPMITERQKPYLMDLMAKRVIPDTLPQDMSEADVDLLTKESAGQMISILINQPKRPSSAGVPEHIPDGRYAFKDDDGVIKFYRVVTRNDNQRYVNKVLGSPGDFRYVRIQPAEAAKVIGKITDDPAMASQLFGIAVGACGICGSPLTDPESIALGIGPICAKKYDW